MNSTGLTNDQLMEVTNFSFVISTVSNEQLIDISEKLKTESLFLFTTKVVETKKEIIALEVKKRRDELNKAFFKSDQIRTWKDAVMNPPKEAGRYWCYVRELKDLGFSYYQWNCSYNPNDSYCWSDGTTNVQVLMWTELLENPDIK